MATADEELNEVKEQEEQEGLEDAPRMPHCEMAKEQLDLEYPSLVAPPDDDLQDVQDDAADAVYQHGLRIAESIAVDMAVHGRTRHGPRSSINDLSASEFRFACPGSTVDPFSGE